MVSYRRQRRQSAKLQPKSVGPYCMIEVLPNHTYCVESSGQVSVQNWQWLKLYEGGRDTLGQGLPC